MNEAPNTEVTISEIMGAITLRVLWAVLKKILAFALLYGVLLCLTFFFGSDYKVADNWLLVWLVLAGILTGWAYLYSATGKKSFHQPRWYFPKTNAFTSLLMSAYAGLLVWMLFSLERSVLSATIFIVLYSIPLYIHYILKCGYYLVMLHRYPNYKFEDFAIEMPPELYELSLERGGITGRD